MEWREPNCKQIIGRITKPDQTRPEVKQSPALARVQTDTDNHNSLFMAVFTILDGRIQGSQRESSRAQH